MKRKTIIISDIHLWMPEANHDLLLNFLKKNTCENLIINGDLVDGLYIKILWKRKNKFDDFFDDLERIRKKNQTKMFYIRWNHEIFINKIAAFKNFKIIDNMIYVSFGKKYYICHGHQFDFANRKAWILFYIAFFSWNFIHLIDRTYNRIRKRLGMKKFSLIKPMKRVAKALIWGTNKLDKKIYQKAIEEKCDSIICGHLHTAENRKLWNIHYLNSWDGIETCSALTEDHKWKRKIVYYKE